LAAAKALLDQGVEVLVFEANDRVGGRTLTKVLDPKPVNGFSWVDLGGAFVGPSQNAVLSLLKEFNLTTYKIFAEQDWLVFTNGQRTRYNGEWLVIHRLQM
jgi:monoamine oxidase